jgi:hypothetical protein
MRKIWLPAALAVQYDRDPAGEWVTPADLPAQWDAVIAATDELRSLKIKELIQATLDGTLQWEFGWCWFTGGMWFPVFTAKQGTELLRMQLAWPPKEWGFIVVITGDGGYFYDSALDDAEYIEVGMELWHLAEDYCVNRDTMIVESAKRVAAATRGEHYPPVPDKGVSND